MSEIASEAGDDPAPPVARTRSVIVYRELRHDILRGRWPPATRLKFEALKDIYEVGLSPLREALMKLTSDRIVQLEEHRGFRVAPVSKADLLDITLMRKQLESLAIRLSIEHGGDRWEAGVVAALHELGRRRKIGDDGLVDDEWERRHCAFHNSLTAACGSAWLLRFREQLYDQADRYRRLSVQYLKAPRDDLAEHREIAEATLARDAEAAMFLTRRHLDRTCRTLLAGDPAIFGE